MNKKNKLGKILSLVVLSPMLLYIAGILNQFIINIRAWKAAGSDMSVSPGLPIVKIGPCLSSLLKFPEGLISIAIVFGGVAILVMMRLHPNWGRGGRLEAGRNLTISESGSYGTSAFMSDREARACFVISPETKTSQDILGMLPNGKVFTLPERTRLNSNIAVCGASGTGKSRSMSRNLIFQAVKREESIIITDPKSELYESMSEYLRNEGYVVRVFNLVQMEHSDSWNCLNEVGSSELMAQIFSDVILSNTGDDGRDSFWYSAELNLLKALVLYVALELPPEKRTLAQVYDLLCFTKEKDLTSEMLRVG